MWRQVISYSASWRAADNVGIIYLLFANNDYAYVLPESTNELHALVRPPPRRGPRLLQHSEWRSNGRMGARRRKRAVQAQHCSSG